MGNLPISAHITVVSNAAPAAPDASSSLPGAVAPAGNTDFSNLLAKQIATKHGVSLPDEATLEAADKLPEANIQAQDGTSPLIDGNLAAILPVVSAQVPNEARLAPVEGEADVLLGRGKRLGGSLDDRSLRHVALDSIAKDGLAEENLPANIAARPAVLPVAREIDAAVNGALRVGERDLKLVSRADADIVPAAERNPAGFAHGLMVAKADAAAGATAIPAVTVESRVGAPAWGAELGQKVVWLANQQQQVAQINVTPPNLGPIQIQLNLASDQANAIFISPHAAVRDAIEAALPQLREMLAENGLSLGNVDVSSQSPNQFGQTAQEFARQNNPASRFAPEMDASPSHNLANRAGAVRSGQGIVDLFA